MAAERSFARAVQIPPHLLEIAGQVVVKLLKKILIGRVHSPDVGIDRDQAIESGLILGGRDLGQPAAGSHCSMFAPPLANAVVPRGPDLDAPVARRKCGALTGEFAESCEQIGKIGMATEQRLGGGILHRSRWVLRGDRTLRCGG